MERVVSTENKPIKLWLDDIEDGALEQAKNLANLPFVYKHIAIMPDSHQGYGMPIGGVMVSKHRATLIRVVPVERCEKCNKPVRIENHFFNFHWETSEYPPINYTVSITFYGSCSCGNVMYTEVQHYRVKEYALQFRGADPDV